MEVKLDPEGHTANRQRRYIHAVLESATMHAVVTFGAKLLGFHRLALNLADQDHLFPDVPSIHHADKCLRCVFKAPLDSLPQN